MSKYSLSQKCLLACVMGLCLTVFMVEATRPISLAFSTVPKQGVPRFPIAQPLNVKQTVSRLHSRRIPFEAYPQLPEDSRLVSWEWKLDTPRHLLPPWLLYIAPWEGSSLFALSFQGLDLASAPSPVRLQFSGVVRYLPKNAVPGDLSALVSVTQQASMLVTMALSDDGGHGHASSTSQSQSHHRHVSVKTATPPQHQPPHPDAYVPKRTGAFPPASQLFGSLLSSPCAMMVSLVLLASAWFAGHVMRRYHRRLCMLVPAYRKLGLVGRVKTWYRFRSLLFTWSSEEQERELSLTAISFAPSSVTSPSAIESFSSSLAHGLKIS